MTATVARINLAPVKGLALDHPDEVELTERGLAENRRFYLWRDGRLFNGKDCGALVRVRPEAVDGRLALRFPEGHAVDDELRLGARVVSNFWGRRDVHGRVVEGPFARALSEYAGEDVQLVRVDDGESAVDVHVGTLVSLASCERLAAELGAHVDARRFRMLLELDGVGAHEEDTWTRVRAGDAVLRVRGPVPRCAVTTQDPETGVPTLDTLRAIKGYRGLRDGKTIDFGVYFDVERPGRVRVGDAVEPL
jgi:uncharacterized protein YcbX